MMGRRYLDFSLGAERHSIATMRCADRRELISATYFMWEYLIHINWETFAALSSIAESNFLSPVETFVMKESLRYDQRPPGTTEAWILGSGTASLAAAVYSVDEA